MCDGEILGEVGELIFPEREKKLVRERDSLIAYTKIYNEWGNPLHANAIIYYSDDNVYIFSLLQ